MTPAPAEVKFSLQHGARGLTGPSGLLPGLKLKHIHPGLS